MTRDKFIELDATEQAAKLNEAVAAGKDKAGAMEEFGVTQADIMKSQVFWVKDKFIARAWGGYTSTKRTGNEAGDTSTGVGDSDPSKGYNGI